MKKIPAKLTSPLILLLFFYLNGKAQTSTNRYGRYMWIQSVLLTPCDKNGVHDPNADPITSNPKQKFGVYRVTQTEAVIKIVAYKDSALQQKFNYRNENTYYAVALSDLDEYAVRDNFVPGSLALGVINFPFKYRAQKGLADFSGSFNFGAAIGYKLPHKVYAKWNVSLMTAYSISNINLDSVSVTQNQSKLTSSNNFTAFSFSFGALLEYDKVQAGFFVGWDNLSRINQLTYGWKYQGKPWVSVGFGYSIFSAGKAAESTEKTQ